MLPSKVANLNPPETTTVVERLIRVSTITDHRNQQLFFDPMRDQFWLRLTINTRTETAGHILKALSHDAAFALAGSPIPVVW